MTMAAWQQSDMGRLCILFVCGLDFDGQQRCTGVPCVEETVWICETLLNIAKWIEERQNIFLICVEFILCINPSV